MSFKHMKNILFLLLLSYMNPKFINLNIESLDDLDNIIKRETETKKAKKKLSESVGTNKDECLASERETIQIFNVNTPSPSTIFINYGYNKNHDLSRNFNKKLTKYNIN